MGLYTHSILAQDHTTANPFPLDRKRHVPVTIAITCIVSVMNCVCQLQRLHKLRSQLMPTHMVPNYCWQAGVDCPVQVAGLML